MLGPHKRNRVFLTPHSPAPQVSFSPINDTHAIRHTTHQPRCFPPLSFAGLPFSGFAGKTWQNGMVFVDAGQ
jgi:hypothetical protein